MKRLPSLVAIFLLGCSEGQALAPGPLPPLPSATIAPLPPLPDPGLQRIPPGDDKIEPLSVGQPAPFSGQLFEPRTAQRWGGYLEQCRVRLDVDPKAQRQLGQVESTFWRSRLEQERGYYQTVIEGQQKQITSLASPPRFYQSPWFYFALGVATSGVLVGVGAHVTR